MGGWVGEDAMRMRWRSTAAAFRFFFGKLRRAARVVGGVTRPVVARAVMAWRAVA